MPLSRDKGPRQFRSRRLRLVARIAQGAKKNRRAVGARGVAQLAGLSEATKRRRLLELLLADVGEESPERVDRTWKMPDLDADGRTASAGPRLDFGYRACEVQLCPEALGILLRSCRMVFALDGSSWLPCGAEPRCLAERLAAEVFAHHTRDANFDPSRSGAEWWAQVRQGGHTEEAVQFHWDTDECAVEQRGVNVHPHLSTVTYLTDCGAATLIVDRRNPLKPHDVARTTYGPIRSGLLSLPRVGKHIVFDGQLLHGTAPQPGEIGERVTFLVNVWLNHQPFGCRRLPKSMALRLGGAEMPPTLRPAEKLPKLSVDSGSHRTFETTFGRQEHEHRLRVPLPASCDTAKLEWAKGADLCGI